MMILPTPAQKVQWEEEGYLVFENAIQGEDLKRLQTAFDYWADACKAEWLDSVEAGEAAATFYDIPNPFGKRPDFHRHYRLSKLLWRTNGVHRPRPNSIRTAGSDRSTLARKLYWMAPGCGTKQSASH